MLGALKRTTLAALVAAPLLSACSGADINPFTKFSSAAYGVAASPRVTTSRNVPKGGGRYLVGKPYKVAGRWYTPAVDEDYVGTGTASWYGPNFHGRRTANGEIFDQYALSGAHPTLPLPSYVRVTNLENGRAVTVRINDRGPYAHGRVIDLSARAAQILGYQKQGTANVRVQYLGPAPLEGDDTRVLMASYEGPMLAGMGGGRGLLAYADGAGGDALAVSAAADAASLMASGGLEAGAAVSFDLGTYVNVKRADDVMEAFAVLGAVTPQAVSLNGLPATTMRLTWLKAGVTPEDVRDLAARLGIDPS